VRSTPFGTSPKSVSINMTPSDQIPAVAARKWQRMPAQLRVELEAAVEVHLKRYRSRHYGLVRDDPRFSAWTGTYLGDRGEKFFDRTVATVKRAIAHKKRLKALPPLASTAAAGSADASTLFEAWPKTDFDSLISGEAWQLNVMERQLRACVDDDGCVVDPERFAQLEAKASRSRKTILELSKHYGAMRSGEAADQLTRAFTDEFGDQPERVQKALQRANSIIRQMGGLDGTGDTNAG
jgi:hypothetical protein